MTKFKSKHVLLCQLFFHFFFSQNIELSHVLWTYLCRPVHLNTMNSSKPNVCSHIKTEQIKQVNDSKLFFAWSHIKHCVHKRWETPPDLYWAISNYMITNHMTQCLYLSFYQIQTCVWKSGISVIDLTKIYCHF